MNWNSDEYRQLQLPHPDHQEDGHNHIIWEVKVQGDYAVSGSADKTVRVWDLKTQRLLYPPLHGHSGSVRAVQFDPAAYEDVIITGDAEGKVIVWRLSSGEALKTVSEAHGEGVLSLDFDSRFLVTGGRDGRIKLRNRHALDVKHSDIPAFAAKPAAGDRLQEYSLLATFDDHDNAVLAVKLRDSVLVSGSGDSTICIRSLETGEMLQRVNIHQSGVAGLQYNGRFIISGSTDCTARVYDVEQNVELACLEGHTKLIRSVQAVFDDNTEAKTVISGSYDGSIRIWEQVQDTKEWRTHQQFHVGDFGMPENVRPDSDPDEFTNRILSVDFSDDRLVCSGAGPTIHVWDFSTPHE